MQKCITRYCKNKAKKSRKLCSSCAFNRWKKKNPDKYCYNNLKQNSKRRGKVFTLTFQEFKQFCRETDYLTGKGKTGKSYSIDRINPSKGYSIDNIQILTLAQNSRKGTKTLVYNWENKYATVISNIQSEEANKDLPF